MWLEPANARAHLPRRLESRGHREAV